jgi:hypothetical protein
MSAKQHGNAYVTVYQPVAGWKAMLVVWDEDEQEYFPEQTGYFAYKTKEEAIADGKTWAAAEEIEFQL